MLTTYRYLDKVDALVSQHRISFYDADTLKQIIHSVAEIEYSKSFPFIQVEEDSFKVTYHGEDDISFIIYMRFSSICSNQIYYDNYELPPNIYLTLTNANGMLECTIIDLTYLDRLLAEFLKGQLKINCYRSMYYTAMGISNSIRNGNISYDGACLAFNILKYLDLMGLPIPYILAIDEDHYIFKFENDSNKLSFNLSYHIGSDGLNAKYSIHHQNIKFKEDELYGDLDCDMNCYSELDDFDIHDLHYRHNGDDQLFNGNKHQIIKHKYMDDNDYMTYAEHRDSTVHYNFTISFDNYTTLDIYTYDIESVAKVLKILSI